MTLNSWLSCITSEITVSKLPIGCVGSVGVWRMLEDQPLGLGLVHVRRLNTYGELGELGVAESWITLKAGSSQMEETSSWKDRKGPELDPLNALGDQSTGDGGSSFWQSLGSLGDQQRHPSLPNTSSSTTEGGTATIFQSKITHKDTAVPPSLRLRFTAFSHNQSPGNLRLHLHLMAQTDLDYSGIHVSDMHIPKCGNQHMADACCPTFNTVTERAGPKNPAPPPLPSTSTLVIPRCLSLKNRSQCQHLGTPNQTFISHLTSLSLYFSTSIMESHYFLEDTCLETVIK